MADLTPAELGLLTQMERENRLPAAAAERLAAERARQGGAGDMTLTYPSPSAPAPPGAAPAPVQRPSWGEAIGRAEAMYNDPNQPSRGILPAWAETMAREAALPTAGGLAGAAIGGALTLPFGASGAIPGEMIGSGLGEGANQLLGITPYSRTQIGLAMAAPPATRGVLNLGGRALQAGLRRLPGAAPTLHEMGRETMETLPGVAKPGVYAAAEEGLWRPAVDPETLWAPLRRLNPKLLMSGFSKEVNAALKEAKTALEGARPDEAIINRLTALKAQLKRLGDDVPFHTMDASRKLIGKWTRSKDDAVRDLGNRLYGPIMDDIERNATLGGTPQKVRDLLLPAIKATRDQKTAEGLARIVRDSYATESGQLTARIRPGAVVDKIRKDPTLMKRLTPAQQTEIRDILESIKGLPAGQPPAGVQHGAGPTMRRLAFGGTVGGAVGGGYGAMVGGAALDVGTRILGEALQSDLGRSLLRKALEANRGELSTRTLIGIAQSLRATTRPGG